MDQDRKDIRLAEAPPQGALPKPARKTYEPPQIVYRAPLEAMAAVCTPAPPGKAIGGDGCESIFS